MTDEGRPAQAVLRAWWYWDRWCAAQREVKYPGAFAGVDQTNEFEDALAVFAAWAGQPVNGLRERMASARRVLGRPVGELRSGFDVRIEVPQDPDAYRYALAAAVGHS